MIKKNKFKKLIVITGLSLFTNITFAVTSTTQLSDIVATFPTNQWDSDWAKEGCDQNVYNSMFNKAKANYEKIAPSMYDNLVKKQADATPKKPTQAALKCIDGAISQLDGAVTAAQSVYNTIMGVGSIDFQSLGSKAMSKLTDAACREVNNYTSASAREITGSMSSGITGITNQVTGATKIDTPLGTINAGQEVLNAAKTQAGTTTKSTTVRNAVSGVLR